MALAFNAIPKEILPVVAGQATTKIPQMVKLPDGTEVTVTKVEKETKKGKNGETLRFFAITTKPTVGKFLVPKVAAGQLIAALQYVKDNDGKEVPDGADGKIKVVAADGVTIKVGHTAGKALVLR